MMPLALRMAPVTAHQDRQLNGLASPPTSTALGSQVRSGSLWPLSGNCTEKQLPTDTPRPTASFGPCHRPPVPRRACVEPRPLVQTGPQGDSLLACGTRRRRRPSRLRAGEEARGPLDSGSLPSRRSKPLSQAPRSQFVGTWLGGDRVVPSPQSPHFLSERPHSLLIATQLERARQTPVRSEVPRH